MWIKRTLKISLSEWKSIQTDPFFLLADDHDDADDDDDDDDDTLKL